MSRRSDFCGQYLSGMQPGNTRSSHDKHSGTESEQDQIATKTRFVIELVIIVAAATTTTTSGYYCVVVRGVRHGHGVIIIRIDYRSLLLFGAVKIEQTQYQYTKTTGNVRPCLCPYPTNSINDQYRNDQSDRFCR